MAQRMVKCELCDENNDGIWLCKNCNQSLCDKCKRSHQRANVSKHHDIISRAHMFETQGEKACPVDEYCKKHSKEIYILYCKECRVLICRKCLTGNHSKHDVTEIENIFNEKRRKAEKLVRELSTEADKCKTREISVEHERLKKQIKDRARKLKDDVNTAKTEMLTKLSKFIDSSSENHSEKEKALTKLNRCLQSNKSSELLEALEFSLSLQSDTTAKGGKSPEIHFSPGQHTFTDVEQLLGTLSIVHMEPAYTLSYMELDAADLCVRYSHPFRGTNVDFVAQFRGTKPFSESLSSFSIEIENEGEGRLIAIGISEEEFEKDRYPGWDLFSYGYHADDGGIFTGQPKSTDKAESRQCFKGDIMECHFSVLNALCCSLEFRKNGEKVYAKICSNHGKNVYPIIAMGTPGEAVLLREKNPWFR